MAANDFFQAAKQAEKLFKEDIYIIIGVEAVKHTHRAFEDEGFTDKALVKWTPLSEARVKQKVKKDGSIAGILHDTGTLEDSIDYEAQPGQHQTVIGTDVKYAARHNEGLDGMPKREFLGESEVLMEHIFGKIDRQLTQIFGA